MFNQWKQSVCLILFWTFLLLLLLNTKLSGHLCTGCEEFSDDQSSSKCCGYPHLTGHSWSSPKRLAELRVHLYTIWMSQTSVHITPNTKWVMVVTSKKTKHTLVFIGHLLTILPRLISMHKKIIQRRGHSLSIVPELWLPPLRVPHCVCLLHC